MIKKLRVTVDGKPYEVTVEVPDEADAPAAAAPVASAPVSRPAAVPAPASSPAATSPGGPNDVVCPLGGRVVAVDATVGQDVKEGDKIITTETMKMNTFVCAHKAGKVAEILVAVGDTVEEGRVLARIG
ncbi:MAG TPA: biotin/lipoyl-containing protein [Verrucomicrobiae bacterium]|jgi:biotin carboxyl carrier protein|nr:biotin/lipoyl-containing protein [Verrucomicrobiae bacterium]